MACSCKHTSSNKIMSSKLVSSWFENARTELRECETLQIFSRDSLNLQCLFMLTRPVVAFNHRVWLLCGYSIQRPLRKCGTSKANSIHSHHGSVSGSCCWAMSSLQRQPMSPTLTSAPHLVSDGALIITCFFLLFFFHLSYYVCLSSLLLH